MGELGEAVVVVAADGQGTEGVLKNPGLRDGGYIYGRRNGISGSEISACYRTAGGEKQNKSVSHSQIKIGHYR